MNLEEVRAIKRKFIATHWSPETPLRSVGISSSGGKYVLSVGVSSLRRIVGLPLEFEGVPVVYQEIGEIIPFDSIASQLKGKKLV
jgi:hypothetical protein